MTRDLRYEGANSAKAEHAATHPEPAAPDGPVATIVIASKNRREELRLAVQSALLQSARIEVLVIDDGSTDGTSEMIRQDFPTVRLHRADVSRGYIHQRNRGAELARSDIIFSIDDDAIFPSSETVQQTLRDLTHPRIGAIAIPYIEPHKTPATFQRAPNDTDVFVTNTFIGTAHAIRRNVFLKLGGYRECLIHQGEEADLCIRMMAAGYVVRLGTADPIHHMESPRRDFSRMDFYGPRNEVLYAWHNVPSLYLPIHMLGTTFHALQSTIRKGCFVRRMYGNFSGWKDSFKQWRQREPVERGVYLLSRRLKKRGPRTLSQIEAQLPVSAGVPDS